MEITLIDLVPDIARAVAATAVEALVCFPAHLPEGLAGGLRAFVPSAIPLEFQCPPLTAAGLIMRLLSNGHQVFEASDIPPETQVYFDRRHGFRLPAWAMIPDPFSAACKLVWSRTAAFGRIQGTISIVVDNPGKKFLTARMVENPYLRLSLPKSLGAISTGQTVTFLSRHDFRFGMEMPLLECVAVFDDDGRDIN